MNKISNLLWGLCFVVVGIIFGLNALEITSINIFFDGWWTLFIIVPSFIGLFSDNDKSSNLIGLIIGLALLLGCRDVLEFKVLWKLIIPFILVTIGLSLMFKDALNNKVKKEINKGLKDLEQTLNNTARTSDGNLNFMSGITDT